MHDQGLTSMYDKWIVARVLGRLCNFMWYGTDLDDQVNVEFVPQTCDDDCPYPHVLPGRVVFYSANVSHAMYANAE